MKEETLLAKFIDTAGVKSAYDASCKRLLASKVILAWILKSCVKEFADCTVSEIAENYIEGQPQVAQIAVQPDETASEQIHGMSTEDSTMLEGTVKYDIRFYAAAPSSGERIRLIINVEAQNKFRPGYPLIKRAIYYCSRMISSQYGTEFTDSHYEKIKKVYSIWICMNPDSECKNSINRYVMKEENLFGSASEKVKNYDLLTVVMVCLGGSEAQTNDVIRLLDVLLSSGRTSSEKKEILQNDFSIKMTRELEQEVMTMCNLSEGVEEKGMAKERAKTLEYIKNLMKNMDLTATQAMNVLGFSDEDKAQFMELLEK